MAVATTSSRGSAHGYIERPRPSSLADVIDVILDKGLVIDAYVRVSLIGIELITIDARIVIASVDTYLRFAEAVNRLDLAHEDESMGLPELMDSVTSGGAKSKAKGALEGVKEKVFGDEDDDEGRGRKQGAKKRASSSKDRSRSSSRSRAAKSRSGRGSSSE